jgi:hypothetical protein
MLRSGDEPDVQHLVRVPAGRTCGMGAQRPFDLPAPAAIGYLPGVRDEHRDVRSAAT